jgi:uncharacterized protein
MENFRLSPYTIFTQLVDNNFILVHGYTGAIDMVNKKIANYLKTNKNDCNQFNFPFSEDTWNRLIKRGYITNKSKDDEIAVVKKMANLIHQKNKVLFKHFGFVVSYDCNFRCPYCYEKQISKGGSNWSKKIFTVEMVDKAYETMLKIEARKELHSKTILLYGGEPLLKENKEIVKYIITKGKLLGYSFMAITNGYDLNEFEELLSSDQICALQVTIDGNKELHDQRRLHYITGESFDKITDNIAIALKHGVKVTVRINTDNRTFNDLNTLKEIFDNKGYTDNRLFQIYSALLFDYEKDIESENNAINDSNVDFIQRKSFNKKHFQSENQYHFEDNGTYQKLSSAIKNHTLLKFDSNYCASQYGTYLFDPYGDIYGCWESVGNKDTKIGSFISFTLNETLKKWHSRNVGVSKNCSICKYLFLCRGGCANKAIRLGGGFDSSYCDHYPDTFSTVVNKVYRDLISDENR